MVQQLGNRTIVPEVADLLAQGGTVKGIGHLL